MRQVVAEKTIESDKTTWFGREDFVDLILELLREDGQNVILMGVKGIGKTAILKKIRQLINCSTIQVEGRSILSSVFIDCGLIKPLLEETKNSIELLADDLNRQLTLNRNGETYKIFEENFSFNFELFEQLQGSSQESNLYIILDDFHKLGSQSANKFSDLLLSTISPYLQNGTLHHSIRVLIGTSIELTRLANNIDDPVSHLAQRCRPERVPFLRLEEELNSFAKEFYKIKSLNKEEISFLSSNSGGHPRYLNLGLSALADGRRHTDYRPNRKSLISVYFDLAERSSRISEHILQDLFLCEKENQGVLFQLYNLSWKQLSWFRKGKRDRENKDYGRQDDDHEENSIVQSSRYLEDRNTIRLRHLGLLMEDTDKAFADIFADYLVERMHKDKFFRQHVFQELSSTLSALELSVLDIFLKNPGKEWTEEELDQNIEFPTSKEGKDRSVYSAVTRVQDKLEKQDPFKLFGRINKMGRKRGWILESNAYLASVS